jgi:cytochrome c-type biogenesis protein CcmH/NrfG
MLPFLWPIQKKIGFLPSLISVIIVFSGVYLLYGIWGNMAGIESYYSKEQQAYRAKQHSIRPLLVQFRKAEQRYLLRVENNPKDREAWLNLGQIYLIQQEKERAEMAFTKAREAL